MEFLKNEEIEEICVNYIVQLEDFEVSENDYCEWMNIGGQPTRWKEFSLRLEMKNGLIIEIEYCTHQYHLLKYLNSKEINNVKVPFMNEFNCALAPLELLEIIKRSHLFFNILNDSWLKHFLDIEMIHLIQKVSETHDVLYLGTAFEDNELIWLVYYDRLTKRIVKMAQDEKDSYDNYIDIYCFNIREEEIRHVVRDGYSESLFSVFGVNEIQLNPSFLGDSSQSIEYMSQAIAGNILKTSIFRVVNSEELEKLILKSMQKALDCNYKTYLFMIIIEVYWKISERIFDMLHQPERLEALFNTKTEMLEFKFKNYPIDLEKDDVKDISHLNGLYICSHYLPIHLIMNIMSYSHSASDIIHLTQLDKSWNQIFEIQDVWKYLYFSRYPTPSQYYSVKSTFQAKSWKLQVLARSKLNRIPLLSSQGCKGLAEVFKSKFIGKSEAFKQFISDFYANTYIVSKKEVNNSSGESKTLKATLMIFWPRQAPLQVDLEIYLDYAEYRSGDSKGGFGSREKVTVRYFGGKSSYYSNQPLILRSITNPEDFIGRYYLSILSQQQYASLFSTLAVLGFGKNWTSEVLGYSW